MNLSTPFPSSKLSLIAVLAAVTLVSAPATAQDLGIEVGAKAPAVTVQSLDGKQVDLSRYIGKTPGRLMCVFTPSGFEEFFEEIGAMSPQQQQNIPRLIEIGKKFGLEYPPRPGA